MSCLYLGLHPWLALENGLKPKNEIGERMVQLVREWCRRFIVVALFELDTVRRCNRIGQASP